MLTLSDIAIVLLLLSVGAWLWHGHGVREQALRLAKAHCAKLGVELLDGNVAFNRYQWLRDKNGKKRLARRFSFEFTVTGEQRLTGHISLYGKRFAAIMLDAHPFVAEPHQSPSAQVIDLADWRRENSNHP